jgi:uncharacterized membrane protein YfcA
MDITTLLLCIAAFSAGFVDSIVGGGGLIQTPALLIILPNYPVATLLGTTKIPSFAGTSIAAYQYSKKVTIYWKLVIPIMILAFSAAMMGSRLASMLSNTTFKPIILVLLIIVAIYTYSNKKFGLHPAKDVHATKAMIAGLSAGLVIGFYDGFIGPGAGSFLILVFIGLLGQDFLHASAHAKLVNLSTNLASIIYFSYSGHILYQFAIPMAICNVTGSFVGSKLALNRGNAFIRVFFLLIVTGTIIRFAWDVFKSSR